MLHPSTSENLSQAGKIILFYTHLILGGLGFKGNVNAGLMMLLDAFTVKLELW